MKSKVALIKRWIRILNGKSALAVKQGMGRAYSLESVKGYYNDLTGKLKAEYHADSQGIMMNKNAAGDYVYFPINVFQHALAVWDMYLITGEAEYRNVFMNSSNWALDSIRDDGSWDTFSMIGHTKYTVSSMGQGQGVSVLVRAYLETGDNLYMDTASKAISFMIREIGDAREGTLFKDGERYIFEEYPNMDEKPSSVLNGWIFSLFGLIDYLKAKEDPVVRQIYEQSVQTLANELGFYDNGYWSLYDRWGRIASPAYHLLHISLLEVMFDLTGREEFIIYANKFRDYNCKKINLIRAAINKLIQKMTENIEGVLIE